MWSAHSSAGRQSGSWQIWVVILAGAVAVVALIVLVVANRGSDVNDDVESPSWDVGNLDFEYVDSIVSSQLGQDGGSISIVAPDGGTITLSVPEGALSEAVDVTMTPIRSIGGMPEGLWFIAGVDLAPPGTAFSSSATLTFSLPASVHPELVEATLIESDKADLLPTDPSAGGVMVSVDHFSAVTVFESMTLMIQTTLKCSGSEDEIQNVYWDEYYRDTASDRNAKQRIITQKDGGFEGGGHRIR